MIKKWAISAVAYLAVVVAAYGIYAAVAEPEPAPSHNEGKAHAESKGSSSSEGGHDTHGTTNEHMDDAEVFSTKNVTRLTADNAIEAAIKVSKTIWPATQDDNRPGTVILAPADNWQISLASLDLIHHPNNGPVLFYEKGKLPKETLNEIKRLNPIGAGGADVMVMGDAGKDVLGKLKDYSIKEIKGTDPAEFAASVDEAYAEAAGELPKGVIIVSSEEEAKLYSILAGNWIAHMPEPILYVTKDSIPEATKAAIEKRSKEAALYVLGPESVISAKVLDELKQFGAVTRISGDSPASASIAFAKFKDEKTGFGWGLTEPGHGLGFVSTKTADFGIAGAPFAHLGKHAPLIWLEDGKLSDETHEFLGSIQPKFKDDPTVGPYNHAFLIGSGKEVGIGVQGLIDAMLEIVPEGGGGHGAH